jgi:catechol 2,3-dioxygenase-like lactoylglutathione lyase family enzyme
MTEVIGIDHIYISVSDLDRSEAFYDKAMAALGFRKNTFTIGGDQDGLRLEVTNYRAERRQRHDEWATRGQG